MPEALVLGGSGQIGAAVIRRLVAAGWQVHAVSRQPRGPDAGVRWLRGELGAMPAVPTRVDAIASCGPLDHFAAWHARAGIEAGRVVAFGSTSVEVKRDSADPDERALAGRLRQAEDTLAAASATRGIASAVLRPTLVYGSGGDRTLTRIAGIARRAGGFVLPADALGRRQPVHVDDLADAAFAALTRAPVASGCYDLPGGETLAYREMVARVLSVLDPPRRLLLLPSPLFGMAAMGARALGVASGFGAAVHARLREDLVFDPAPARAALGYAPRAFEPTDAMFRRAAIAGA